MARTRSIKPEFWDDEKLATVSRDARLTFIGIWTNSDDYGVVKGHPAWLKNTIFPYDEIKLSEFQKWLKDLEQLFCIIPFDHNGEKFYYIKNFKKHQTINRPSQAKNPSPPESLINNSLNTHGALTSETETETETETEERESKTPPLPPACPHQEIIKIFHETCPELPRVVKWTGTRSQHLQACWKDKERQSLQWWREYFRRVRGSPFLNGDNDRGWKADLEWLTTESNLVKVLEGKYDGTNGLRNGKGFGPSDRETAEILSRYQ